MKKNQLVKTAAALSLTAAMLVPAASALNWMDGAPANYRFTFSAAEEGVGSVVCSDKNGTASLSQVNVGDTVTTKTGTIVWRDSYENVTTFTVDMLPGYALVGVSGKNVDGIFEQVDKDTWQFHFTDRGAEAWCFNKDVAFELDTEKLVYTFVTPDGTEVGTGKVGEAVTLKDADKYGYIFEGYLLNNEAFTDGATLTEGLLDLADENNQITVYPQYTAVNCTLTLTYYIDSDNGVDGGEIVTPDGLPTALSIPFGTPVTESYLHDAFNIPEEWKVIGNESLTMDVENSNALRLVKADKATSGAFKYDYTMTYAGGSDNIASVSYSVDGGEAVVLEKNETVKVATGAFKNTVVVFTVETVDGTVPALTCEGTENIITDNEDGTFSFQITVNDVNTWSQAHFDFYLG